MKYRRYLETGKFCDIFASTLRRRKKNLNFLKDKKCLKWKEIQKIKDIPVIAIHPIQPNLIEKIQQPIININFEIQNSIAIHFDQYTSLDEDLYKELFCENHKHFDDKNGFSQPKDLQSMIKDPNFFMIPSTVVNKTGGEILLMCLKNALQSHLGITQIMDLFKLINSMFHQPILPNSKYYLDKILSNNCDVKLHSICSECKVYVGKFKNSLKISNITYLGIDHIIPDKLATLVNLSANNCQLYSRIIKDGCLYSSRNYENKRSNNSNVQLEDGRFVEGEFYIARLANMYHY
ncbi:hypothetical protein TKK_0019078 [Trichogramma kaykai]